MNSVMNSSRDVLITWNKQSGTPLMDVARGDNDEFVLADGRRIYDFSSTSFQASFGHSCEVIRKPVREQLDRMPVASPKSTSALREKASTRLLQLLQLENGGKLFYTVSGSESVENALKIARHWTGKPVILARTRSYHGASLGAMSVSGDWRSSGHLNFTEGTVRIPEPDDDPQAAQFEEVIEQTGARRVAAVIVETISGVNGVVIPPQSWWDGVSRVCARHGILLICDEVLAGFGRTGPAFAFHHFALRPDLVTMSKGITGGYVPFGAVWVSPKIAARYDNEVLACGLTSYAHPLGLAAMSGVLDLLEDETFNLARQKLEATFSACLTELCRKPFVTGCRHRGLLAAIEISRPAPDWQSFIDAGLYLVTRANSVILAPPFTSEPGRLEKAFHQLSRVLA
jgi:taurine---2-oxoglutarate transaminase